MLERMYHRRLHGYAVIGYQSKGVGSEDDAVHIIYDNRSFFPVYSQDIRWAKRSILIVSPFVKQKRVSQLLQILQEPLDRKVEITVVTRPADDFTDKHKVTFKQSVRAMKDAGIKVIFKPKIHQKLAVIDQKTVWYGSINLLSFGSSEESMMRIVSGNIALELIDSLSIESVTQKIPYKTDSDTDEGKYASRGARLSKYYE
jgi:phosphatidylserine/phosphatidylglycerophosphate/cardiolipin synthase-like enzyme